MDKTYLTDNSYTNLYIDKAKNNHTKTAKINVIELDSTMLDRSNPLMSTKINDSHHTKSHVINILTEMTTTRLIIFKNYNLVENESYNQTKAEIENWLNSV